MRGEDQKSTSETKSEEKQREGSRTLTNKHDRENETTRPTRSVNDVTYQEATGFSNSQDSELASHSVIVSGERVTLKISSNESGSSEDGTYQAGENTSLERDNTRTASNFREYRRTSKYNSSHTSTEQGAQGGFFTVTNTSFHKTGIQDDRKATRSDGSDSGAYDLTADFGSDTTHRSTLTEIGSYFDTSGGRQQFGFYFGNSSVVSEQLTDSGRTPRHRIIDDSGINGDNANDFYFDVITENTNVIRDTNSSFRIGFYTPSSSFKLVTKRDYSDTIDEEKLNRDYKNSDTILGFERNRLDVVRIEDGESTTTLNRWGGREYAGGTQPGQFDTTVFNENTFLDGFGGYDTNNPEIIEVDVGTTEYDFSCTETTPPFNVVDDDDPTAIQGPGVTNPGGITASAPQINDAPFVGGDFPLTPPVDQALIEQTQRDIADGLIGPHQDFRPVTDADRARLHEQQYADEIAQSGLSRLERALGNPNVTVRLHEIGNQADIQGTADGNPLVAGLLTLAETIREGEVSPGFTLVYPDGSERTIFGEIRSEFLAGQAIGGGSFLKTRFAKPVAVAPAKPVAAAPNTTILGNGQTTRVVPFAERTGARTLDNGLTQQQWEALTPRQQFKVNDGQLRKHINAGDRFRDIGPDGFERSLDLRKAELLRLKERGIPVERVSPDEIRRVLGE